jgi:hypothetical protein
MSCPFETTLLKSWISQMGDRASPDEPNFRTGVSNHLQPDPKAEFSASR